MSVFGPRGGSSRRELEDEDGASDPMEDDAFEEEMEEECLRRAQQARELHGWSDQSGPADPGAYDPVYFDSDEEDSPLKVQPPKKVITNDDLLYDPEADELDQAWSDRKRLENRQGPSSAPRPPALAVVQPESNSDAVLNCPACFSLLCLDCQRHDVYQTQYRAMFVENCSVDLGQKLQCPKSKGNKRPPRDGSSGQGDDDIFHPVKCQVCSTEVAMQDTDEVYHFFNVLASHS